MIKLLGLLLPFTLLQAEQNFFLFPDQKNNFVHHVTRSIKRTQNRIIVITPSFEQNEIKTSLLQQARKGKRIDLIIQQKDNGVLSLPQYAHMELALYTARPLEGSIILVDNDFACTLTVPIDEKHLSRNAAFARCTDNREEISEIVDTVSPLIRRSVPYLK